MRLIDADALNKEFINFVRASNISDFEPTPNWNDAVSLVGSAPTVDIVRCEECKHNCGEYYGYICCDKTQEISILHRKDWFCKDGERKDDDNV